MAGFFCVENLIFQCISTINIIYTYLYVSANQPHDGQRNMVWKSWCSVRGASTPSAFFLVLCLLFSSILQNGCTTTPRRYAKVPRSPVVEPLALPAPPPPAQTARQLPPADPPCDPPQVDEDIDPGLPVTAPLTSPKIVIKKAQKKLLLYSEEKLIRTYPIKLGLNPVGDKIRQGDKRTPEGSYYICIKNPKSKYHLSLGLSYPGIEDAERGLEQKLITEKDYNRIIERITRKSIPPWDTPLGGEIFIHGGAETWAWTYGCVALNNKDIEELFKVIAVGTEVVIQQ
jgi:hypothetical protein